MKWIKLTNDTKLPGINYNDVYSTMSNEVLAIDNLGEMRYGSLFKQHDCSYTCYQLSGSSLNNCIAFVEAHDVIKDYQNSLTNIV